MWPIRSVNAHNLCFRRILTDRFCSSSSRENLENRAVAEIDVTTRHGCYNFEEYESRPRILRVRNKSFLFVFIGIFLKCDEPV